MVTEHTDDGEHRRLSDKIKAAEVAGLDHVELPLDVARGYVDTMRRLSEIALYSLATHAVRTAAIRMVYLDREHITDAIARSDLPPDVREKVIELIFAVPLPHIAR